MNRHEAERRGRGAETLAFRYFRLKGWRILARRARVPRGGARPTSFHDGAGCLHSLKSRPARTRMRPRLFSTSTGYGASRIAAERLAPRYMRAGDDVRIDAMFVVPRRLPRHLTNVWQG